MSRRKSSLSTQSTRRLGNSQGPYILRVLSRKDVFASYIVLAIIVFALNAPLAYLRVNSCPLLPGGSVSVNGSTALAPLLQDVAKDYQQKCLGTNIFVNTGKLPQGSLKGLQQVEQGDVDIGTSDVFADPSKNPGLEDHQVAVVVFALVVNADVHVTNLTTDQIRRIYNGDILNWHAVGNSDYLDIVRISRPPTSGTRATFEKYVLNGLETVSGPQSLITDTSDTVAKSVQTQPGAIGYVSLFYAKKYGLKIISIDGYSPTQSNLVLNDTYKFWNIEHMYTKGPANGLIKSFIEHMFSDDARNIAKDDAYLSTVDFAPNVLANHVAQT